MLTAAAGQTATDPVARVIAIAGATIALLNLVFNLYKEWWRGRRVRVRLERPSSSDSSLLVAKVSSRGNIAVDLTEWGYRVSHGWLERKEYVKPPTTGRDGPEE